MFTCNDVPVTAQNVARTSNDLKSIFAQDKADGYLPPKATLTLVTSYFSLADDELDTANITANPAALSCLSHKDNQSVIMHEVGHYQDNLVLIIKAQEWVQETLFSSAVAVLLYALFYAAKLLLTRKPDRKLRFLKKKKFVPKLMAIAAACLAAHTLHGLALIFEMRALETRADMYAATAANSGSPMAEALTKLNAIGLTDDSQSDIENTMTVNDFGNMVGRKLFYGVFGYPYGFLDEHPSDEQRIQNLLAYKPGTPAPFGMHIPKRPVVAAH